LIDTKALSISEEDFGLWELKNTRNWFISETGGNLRVIEVSFFQNRNYWGCRDKNISI
jgi:hypothetical protein